MMKLFKHKNNGYDDYQWRVNASAWKFLFWKRFTLFECYYTHRVLNLTFHGVSLIFQFLRGYLLRVDVQTATLDFGFYLLRWNDYDE